MSAALHELAGAALAVLAREGVREAGPAGHVWRAALSPAGGEALALSCAGPDLPAAIPAEIATPERVMSERPWAGTHRLVVRAAGLIVLDLYWTAGEPARIMGFSRGEWERGLVAH